jgi:hypothetical protein
MSKPKTDTNEKQIDESIRSTLEKRVLNSNLSDEDKIILIRLLGNHPDIVSIPSVWSPFPQPLNPTYREHPEYVVTCSLGNDSCPSAKVSCLNDEK